MSNSFSNIVIPNNKVRAVAGLFKTFSNVFNTINLPSIALTPDSGSVVWEVNSFNRMLYKLNSIKTTEIPMATKGKGKNPFDKKCEQCPTLTTRDLHSESDKIKRPQCKGVVFKLGIKEVKFKHPIKCRDVKGVLTNKNNEKHNTNTTTFCCYC